MKYNRLLLALLIASIIPCYAGTVNYSNSVLANNPVAYWKLDETGGSTAFDSSGHGNHGTYHNMNFGSDNPFGATGVRFDDAGAPTYVHVVDDGASSLDVNTITIEAWVKPDTYVVSLDRAMILNKEGTYEMGIHDSSGNLQTALFNTSWFWSGNDTDNIVGLNQWHHVAVTFDGNTARHYIDGVETFSYTTNGVLRETDQDLRIGARDGDSTSVRSFFSGGISHVAVYGTPLSANQIQQNFTAASTVDAIPEPSSFVLIALSVLLLTWKKRR